MPETPHQQHFVSANQEVTTLRDICKSMQLTPIEPVQRDRRTRTRVPAHILRLPFCRPWTFPSSRPLTEHITPPRLDHKSTNSKRPSQPSTPGNAPFLGYLSACSTSTNQVESLADEPIHLANACQLAGFRHMVGTIWEVSDENYVEVAEILYQTRDEGITDMAV